MKFARSLADLAIVLPLAASQAIDLSKVGSDTRDYWCESQISSCPLLCLQIPGASDNPTSNTCDSDSLAFSCVCSNGKSPNASEYSQTIPYFICTEENNQCVTNCNGAHSCQSDCRTKNPCGAQNPRRVNTTTTAAPTATTTTPPTDVVYNGFGSATDDPKNGGSAINISIDIGRVYGLFIVMGSIFAGFSVLL